MKILDRLRGIDRDAQANEAYNLGLAAKYKGEWETSLAQNRRADALCPGDEATTWNLGIASTALSDWDTARKAWTAVGVLVDDGPGEVSAPCGKACVRLDPSGKAEVVWGRRIDPARIFVLNVPLPSSDRRYGDILINDGAPEGTRISDGEEYPVFNELGLWKRSAYSTFEVQLLMPNGSAMESLEAKCRENDMWVEDWGTIRSLCAECSRGNPGEHVCTSEPTGESRFGFASKSEDGLRRLLSEWIEVEEGAELKDLKLAVLGVTD